MAAAQDDPGTGSADASPAAVTADNRAQGRALVGLTSPRVTVETHLPGGLPGFTLVGLPETAVREARDRVRSAILNCGLDYPQGRIVVNLAPAELAKNGARFDLAIAVSILRATRQLPPRASEDYEYLGELGLYGELRATRGCLCAALAVARETPATVRLIVPAVNAAEAAVGPRGRLLAARHLSEVVAFLRDPAGAPLSEPEQPEPEQPEPEHPAAGPEAATDSLDDVLGQHAAKRALEIAAAGGHHLLMVGPPGTGKTMLARRLCTLLPRLPEEHAMEVAAAYSAAALPAPPPGQAPFRDPHHSASAPALAGGGRQALPGEISLAHRGVLFLDELPHFKPSVLNLLREPLESRAISIARTGYRTTFPACFQLVAAMNPCPAGLTCGEYTCRCAPDQVRRYQSRISGPLLDRIDLHVAVPPVPRELMLRTADDTATSAAAVRHQVATARERQWRRQGCLNSELPGRRAVALAALDGAGERLLERATERYGLSARGAHRVLRSARTIADLEGVAAVGTQHLSEALSFRAMDWGGGLGVAGR